MIKTFAVGIVASVLVASVAHASTLLFTLKGTNPDGKSGYRGTVSLTEVATGAHGEKSGIVTWTVTDAAPVRGVVMSSQENPGRLSISFPGKPVPGVAVGQFANDGSVRIVWYVGGQSAGSEVWTRRQ